VKLLAVRHMQNAAVKAAVAAAIKEAVWQKARTLTSIASIMSFWHLAVAAAAAAVLGWLAPLHSMQRCGERARKMCLHGRTMTAYSGSICVVTKLARLRRGVASRLRNPCIWLAARRGAMLDRGKALPSIGAQVSVGSVTSSTAATSSMSTLVFAAMLLLAHPTHQQQVGARHQQRLLGPSDHSADTYKHAWINMSVSTVKTPPESPARRTRGKNIRQAASGRKEVRGVRTCAGCTISQNMWCETI
jgi:hypothetical protein